MNQEVLGAILRYVAPADRRGATSRSWTEAGGKR